MGGVLWWFPLGFVCGMGLVISLYSADYTLSTIESLVR